MNTELKSFEEIKQLGEQFVSRGFPDIGKTPHLCRLQGWRVLKCDCLKIYSTSFVNMKIVPEK